MEKIHYFNANLNYTEPERYIRNCTHRRRCHFHYGNFHAIFDLPVEWVVRWGDAMNNS